ncbi:MAG: hypothetical protein AVDCRST_MAG07-2095, partial [uncultured Frankineae bacterium]
GRRGAVRRRRRAGAAPWPGRRRRAGAGGAAGRRRPAGRDDDRQL